MRKFLNIIFAIISIGMIVYTFMYANKQYDIFGVALNIWVYRGIWGLIAVGSIYRVFNPPAHLKDKE